MAKSKPFSQVPDKAFLAFDSTLNAPPWDSIRAPDTQSALTLKTPQPVVWKARLVWSISTLAVVIGHSDPEATKLAESVWDNAQQRFHLKTEFDARDSDPATSAAALRVRAALLLGDGLAQTRLAWDQEVDFGYNQLKLASESPLSADIASLNLHPLLTAISNATDALAAALGLTKTKNRDASRQQRIRAATTDCRNAFRAVLEDLTWRLAQSPSADDAAQFTALLTTLTSLDGRYP